MSAPVQPRQPARAHDPELLADWAGGRWHGDRRPAEVRGFSFDTRTLRSGECFLALRSERRDGHDFVDEARRLGAACALVERPLEAGLPQLVVDDTLLAMGRMGAAARRAFGGPVVGITGSCGKTSTKEMLRQLLGAETTHATAGNWNNRIGVPLTLLQLDPARHRRAVIEAGINQPGEMEHLGAMIEADVVLLTHIGPAHLEALGTEERVAAEKSELLLRAKPEAPFLLPAACRRFEALRRLTPRSVVVARAGEEVPAGVTGCLWLRTASLATGGQRLELRRDGEAEATFELASPSAGAAMNAALAVAAARHLGESDADLRERLAAWRPEADRGAVLYREGRLFYVDCYNANPASVADALDAFGRLAPPDLPRLYVLGAMEELGPAAEALHRQTAARLVPRPGDRVLLIGPPASTAAYREGALQAGFEADRVGEAECAAACHSEVAGFAGAVFLKGSRRHALEQLLPPGA